MYFNIIGTGKLGKSIALALHHSGLAECQALYNRNFDKASQTAKEIAAGFAVTTLAELPPAEITFISTSDDAITQVVEQLNEQKYISKDSIVVHVSGALSSSILSPLGCHIASFHPLKAFRNGVAQKEIFKHCFCVVEGDPKAVAVLSQLFSALEANIIPISPAAKTTYHAAAVFASNYLVTLAATAMQLFEQAGIPSGPAKKMTSSLMESSLDNIKNSSSLSAALTGPLQRGDFETIKKHLQVLSPSAITAFYCKAALLTLELTQLDEKVQEKLRALLSETLQSL